MAKKIKETKSTPVESGVEDSDVEWKSLATFLIKFESQSADTQPEQRTIVHHRETGQTEQWTGIADQAFSEWILERLSEEMGLVVASDQGLPEEAELTSAPSKTALPEEIEPISASSEAVLPEAVELTSVPSETALLTEAEPTPESSTNLKITNLEITEIHAIQTTDNEVSIVANSDQPFFMQELSSEAPFSLKVAFNTVEATASEMGQQPTPYELKVYISKFDRTKLLEFTPLEFTRTGTLTPEELTHTETFSKVKLVAGVYRMEALVKVGSVISKRFKISPIQVI